MSQVRTLLHNSEHSESGQSRLCAALTQMGDCCHGIHFNDSLIYALGNAMILLFIYIN